MMVGFVLLLHVLAATIWTGGHLLLALTVLPRVMREGSPSKLLEFESAFERIGIPALVVQVATGLWLAHRLVPEVGRRLAFDDPVARLVGVKILLLATTVVSPWTPGYGSFRASRSGISVCSPGTSSRSPSFRWRSWSSA